MNYTTEKQWKNALASVDADFCDMPGEPDFIVKTKFKNDRLEIVAIGQRYTIKETKTLTSLIRENNYNDSAAIFKTVDAFLKSNPYLTEDKRKEIAEDISLNAGLVWYTVSF